MNTLSKHPSHGFSLIEVVIVVVIIGILATIAVPKFADASSGRRLSAASKVIQADLEIVKKRARATSKPHTIKFYPDQEFYVVVEGTDVARENIVLYRDLSIEPYSLEINRTNLGSGQVSIITPFGDVSPGFTVQIRDQGTDVNVVVSGVASTGDAITDSAPDGDTLIIELDAGGLGIKFGL
jgi:prepilin-type N-terminal cleavage/methylation domain-containing protein